MNQTQIALGNTPFRRDPKTPIENCSPLDFWLHLLVNAKEVYQGLQGGGSPRLLDRIR